MAGAKTEMNKWRNSARNETLWCQLEHEDFEKNSGQNNDPQKPLKISSFGFLCDRDFLVSLKQIKKIKELGVAGNLWIWKNWTIENPTCGPKKIEQKLWKTSGIFAIFFFKFWQKVTQKRTALEKLRRTKLPFVFENAW
jgi:hypothetical protein